MDAFIGLMTGETEPIIRAVLGHYIFVYIHPYPDGNGRIGRFIMNAALAAGGFPWTVIRESRRDEYLSALEEATTSQDLRPFAVFVLGEMRATLR
jgi:Fic family protein